MITRIFNRWVRPASAEFKRIFREMIHKINSLGTSLFDISAKGLNVVSIAPLYNRFGIWHFDRDSDIEYIGQ